MNRYPHRRPLNASRIALLITCFLTVTTIEPAVRVRAQTCTAPPNTSIALTWPRNTSVTVALDDTWGNPTGRRLQTGWPSGTGRITVQELRSQASNHNTSPTIARRLLTGQSTGNVMTRTPDTTAASFIISIITVSELSGLKSNRGWLTMTAILFTSVHMS